MYYIYVCVIIVVAYLWWHVQNLAQVLAWCEIGSRPILGPVTSRPQRLQKCNEQNLTITILYLNCFVTLTTMCYLRDWSRSGGSYGNNTRVICCPAPGRPESAARGTSPPDNKSRGCCCRNSRPTVINPDYNMTKQRYITRIYDKKNVQNHHQIERRRLLASIVTSRISP